MKNDRMQKRAFTLMEIIIVVIVLGVIASLGLNSYYKVIETNYCKSAQMQLMRFATAAEVYKAKNGSYGDTNTMGNYFTQLGIGPGPVAIALPYNFGIGVIGTAPNDVFTSQAGRVGWNPAVSCNYTSANPLSATNPSCNNNDLCKNILE